MLQNARKLLKQAHQQAMSSAVQIKLETSIKALDKAHQFANLDSLKQLDEAFQSKSDVQQQLDNFKDEVNSKLDQILHTMSKTKTQSVKKSAFVFEQTNKTQIITFGQPTFLNITKSATYASIASNKD